MNTNVHTPEQAELFIITQAMIDKTLEQSASATGDNVRLLLGNLFLAGVMHGAKMHSATLQMHAVVEKMQNKA